MAGSLKDTVAVVTGGGSGIGRAVVSAFAEEGAAVCVLEKDPDKCAELEQLGHPVYVVSGDATSAEDNSRTVAEAVRRFGRLDTLVTCVGVFDHYTPLADIPVDHLDVAFQEIFDVNVKSVLLATRAATPELIQTKGSIVITASSSSFYPGRGGALYVATKFALRGLVTQLGHELAPDIRVNGVAPGGTAGTDLRGLESLGQSTQRLDDQPARADALKKRTPLAVALTGEDHAGAYVFLASSRARGISGEIIRSDGGMAVK